MIYRLLYRFLFIACLTCLDFLGIFYSVFSCAPSAREYTPHMNSILSLPLQLAPVAFGMQHSIACLTWKTPSQGSSCLLQVPPLLHCLFNLLSLGSSFLASWTWLISPSRRQLFIACLTCSKTFLLSPTKWSSQEI